MYFHIEIILYHLGTPLPHEDGFSWFRNSYSKFAYYIICNDCGTNADEIWINGDWFHTKMFKNV